MNTKEKIRILCIDDDQDLSAMLDLYQKKKEAVLGPIATASNLQMALEQISKDRPDIVVVDLSVDGADPQETIEEIGKRFPEIRIILYSNQDDQALIDEAIEAGASKHVHKGHGVIKLLDAIYETVVAD